MRSFEVFVSRFLLASLMACGSFFYQEAHAGSLEDLKRHPLLKGFFGEPVCPESRKALAEMPAERLWQMGLQAREKGRACDSVFYFQELTRQHPVAPWWKKAWVEIVRSAVQSRDLILTLNEANEFLDVMRGVKEAEEVHYLLLFAVHRQMKELGPERSAEWTEYGLGVHREQHKHNPYLLNLRYDSFLEKYPQSQRLPEVQAWKMEAKQLLAAHWLSVGKFYQKKGEHVAALMRFSLILGWGPGIDVFPEALYESIRAQFLLAKKIESGQISDQRLQELLRFPQGQTNRAELVQATRNEALKLRKMMQENLPGNPWTLKALQLAP